MKYQCFECDEKYAGNSQRRPLNHDNTLILQSSDNYPNQYKCPKCNGTLIFLPLPRNEIIKNFDKEFYFNSHGIVHTFDILNKGCYDLASFKPLGIFPDNLLAENYYRFLKKK